MTQFQKRVPAFCWSFGLFLSLALIIQVSKAHDCLISRRASCEKGFPGSTEIYRDEPDQGRTKRKCCIPDSDGAMHAEQQATDCTATSCFPVSDSGGDLCAHDTGTRTINSTGKKITFVEAVRDSCALDDGKTGVEALCCGEDTMELWLTTLLGVEPHEFPHFARLEKEGEGDEHGICGASIYNERYLITASHCVMDKTKHKAFPANKFKVFLDITISGGKTLPENTYDVEEVIVHPEASLTKKKKHRLNYDIAIMKLTRDIKFSDNVQAIPLAPKNFDAIEFADTAIIVGFGDTDTLHPSRKLQKGDAYIRNFTKNTERGSRYPEHKEDVDQLIFLGGYQDGIPSISASGGDSGGPAICRNKNGNAVLCGFTSFGPSNKINCEKFKNEKECKPTGYVKVDHFRPWIEHKAGNQSKARLMKQPIYGKDVPLDKYPHQVKIVSGNKNNEHNCSGTLIAKDIVLTAAHCVAKDDGSKRKGLMVSQKSQSQKVKSIKVLEGFEKSPQDYNGGARRRRIAVFATKATFDDPYYKNDLALVKLEKGMEISTRNLPAIATAEVQPGLATEIAYMTDTRRQGKLAERNFKLISHADCQKRMNRLTYAGVNIQIDDDIICGVEEYSGGSKCDRTLGGAVMCKGNTLCGVQAFRLCEFAVPNQFVDVAMHGDWIQSTMKTM